MRLHALSLLPFVLFTSCTSADRVAAPDALDVLTRAGFGAELGARREVRRTTVGWRSSHGETTLPASLSQPVVLAGGLRVHVGDAGTSIADSSDLVEYAAPGDAWSTVLAARDDGFEDFHIARSPVGRSTFVYRIEGASAGDVDASGRAVRVVTDDGKTLEIAAPFARDVSGHLRRLDVEVTKKGSDVEILATLDTAGMDYPLVVDPTFVLRPPMSAKRFYHTETKLSDGRVLVAGGGDASADLYDPIADAWTSAGTMSSVRQGHLGIAYDSGTKVLLIGGQSAPGAGINTVDSYDETTKTITAAAPMTHGRVYAFGGLLPSGKILVAGGYESGPIASTEIYDPTAGTWSAGPSLPEARLAAKTVTMADGSLLAIGGREATALSTLVERFDETTGLWTTKAPLPIGGEIVAAKLADGRVLAIAPSTETGAPLASAEIYDPTADAWTVVAPMNVARYAPTATTLPDGKVLVAGGAQVSVILSSAELFDPTAGTWTLIDSMHDPRANFAATLLDDGRVLLTGGGLDSTTAIASAETYGLASNGAGCSTSVECLSGLCDSTNHCASVPDAGPDAPADVSPDGADAPADVSPDGAKDTGSDLGLDAPDAGDTAIDGAATDSSVDAAADVTPDVASDATSLPSESGSGCSCRTAPNVGGDSALVAVAGAMLGLVVARRRRRSVQRRSQ